MNEKTVRQQIRLRVGGRQDVVLLSNPTGLGCVGDIQSFRPGADSTIVHNPRYMAFGLGAKPGKGKGGEFPDLIGWQTVRVTPDMVGQDIAVPLGIEVKSPTGKPTPGQLQKIALMRSCGCIAGVARSADEAEALLWG